MSTPIELRQRADQLGPLLRDTFRSLAGEADSKEVAERRQKLRDRESTRRHVLELLQHDDIAEAARVMSRLDGVEAFCRESAKLLAFPEETVTGGDAEATAPVTIPPVEDQPVRPVRQRSTGTRTGFFNREPGRHTRSANTQSSQPEPTTPQPTATNPSFTLEDLEAAMQAGGYSVQDLTRAASIGRGVNKAATYLGTRSVPAKPSRQTAPATAQPALGL